MKCNFILSDDVFERLRTASFIHRVSMTKIVESALDLYLDKADGSKGVSNGTVEQGQIVEGT